MYGIYLFIHLYKAIQGMYKEVYERIYKEHI